MSLTAYLERFGNLHRHVHGARGAAPHKPILLLAILHEMDLGHVPENRVSLSPELVATFHAFWEALVPPDSGWNERMAYPFRYLRQDGFWELVKNGLPVAPESGRDYTLNQLATLCDGGRFSDELWPLLQDAPIRAIFRQHLLTTYFGEPAFDLAELATARYLATQAEMLKQQANAKFRLHPTIREQRTDGYFVRNRLFPKVIKELYGYSCCVCDLTVRLNSGESLVDAAHILPFSEFQNDDPRNGIALCKNHHWGFDGGAWSLTDSGEILVSPKLASESVFVVAGQPIASPRDERYRPARPALQWHRQRWQFD